MDNHVVIVLAVILLVMLIKRNNSEGFISKTLAYYEQVGAMEPSPKPIGRKFYEDQAYSNWM